MATAKKLFYLSLFELSQNHWAEKNDKYFKQLLEKSAGRWTSDLKTDGCGLSEDRVSGQSVYNPEKLSLLTFLEKTFFFLFLSSGNCLPSFSS